jgi:hypothetical protein
VYSNLATLLQAQGAWIAAIDTGGPAVKRIVGAMARTARSQMGIVVPLLFLMLLAWPAQAFAALPPFAPALQLASGGKATTFAALADLNGDGHLDIAAVNFTSNDMSVFQGDGKGGFSGPAVYPVGLGPKSITLCDVTGDGTPDAVVPLEGENAVAVVPGDGGAFGSPVLYPVDQGPKQVAVADLNHDGLADIVSANEVPNTLSVLLGRPGGGFLRLPDVGNASRPRWVAVGDFNEDGNPDLAVASESTAGLDEVFLGDGLGGFVLSGKLPGGISHKSMVVADFNEDGHQDIASSDESVNDVRVLLGDGAGGFVVRSDVPVGTMPKCLYATDLDGDGHTDLIAGNYASDSVSVLLGDGAGGFASPVTLAAGNGPKSVATGDVDGDGAQDMVVADNDSSSVSVIRADTSAVTDVGVSPVSFYGGAGASGRTTITYRVRRPAAVSVFVRDAAGRVVRMLQPTVSQEPGSYSLLWNGVGDGSASLAEGAYSVVVDATSGGVFEESSGAVTFSLTPMANEAALSLDASGQYVLHTVVEKWSEAVSGQTQGDFYRDGRIQPWEFAACSTATVTLFVGADSSHRRDSSLGGTVNATTDPLGVADVPFPAGLTWRDAGGRPVPLYYSVQVTFGGSSRWYPAAGRYPLSPTTTTGGHIRFALIGDIQTPSSDVPTPTSPLSDLDAAHGAYGPYSAIPRLSRSRGWAAVLAGLRRERGLNLVLGAGDEVAVGSDGTAPDDGNTQLRTLFDNRQYFPPTGGWRLGSLGATVPLALAPGNHDGINSPKIAARWQRWVHTPSGLPYFSIDDGDVHFVVLDNYYASSSAKADYRGWIGLQSSLPGGSHRVTVNGVAHRFANSAQADWLIHAIDTTKPWTVVVMHYPMFDSTGGPYSDGNQTGTPTSTNMYYYGERDRLLHLFAAHGVDLVLQGHIHYYRRHLEKVHTADGAVTSAQTYITEGLAGGPPDEEQKDEIDPAVPFFDWVDLDHDGVRDPDEPLATSADAHWDEGHFGTMNSLDAASGYFGLPDMFHATGQEYDDGLSFSYAIFQTGAGALGAPTLTLTVERISWDATTHAWGPWAVAETVNVPQLDGTFVADRLNPGPPAQIARPGGAR